MARFTSKNKTNDNNAGRDCEKGPGSGSIGKKEKKKKKRLGEGRKKYVVIRSDNAKPFW